jgi:hypothetical protein
MEIYNYSGNASPISRDIIVAAKAVATLQLPLRQTIAWTAHVEW